MMADDFFVQAALFFSSRYSGVLRAGPQTPEGWGAHSKVADRT
jgi:hypothetical protein